MQLMESCVLQMAPWAASLLAKEQLQARQLAVQVVRLGRWCSQPQATVCWISSEPHSRVLGLGLRLLPQRKRKRSARKSNQSLKHSQASHVRSTDDRNLRASSTWTVPVYQQ